MTFIGTVTIAWPHVGGDRSYGNKSLIISNDKPMRMAFPPETVLLKDYGTHDAIEHGVYKQKISAISQIYYEDGVGAKITGKSRKMHSDFENAQELYEASKFEIDVSEIQIGENKIFIPMAFDSLLPYFTLARTGHNVFLRYDAESRTWTDKVEPLKALTMKASQKRLRLSN